VTRGSPEQATGAGAVLRDELTGATRSVDARAVVNAAGVWAGEVAPGITLRPSRGAHLVLSQARFGGLGAGLTVPVPGESNRAVMALPAPGGRVYVGLTDVESPGEIPDVPVADDAEIDFLLQTASSALTEPLTREDVLGVFAGLRPLLDTGGGRTADVSRKHAVITGADGLVTVVGGKLTTYRRMAQDALDAAVARAGLAAGPCWTKRLPLVGAAPRAELARVPAPLRLVRRYGVEAPGVLALAKESPELLEPIAEGSETIGAELAFAVLGLEMAPCTSYLPEYPSCTKPRSNWASRSSRPPVGSGSATPSRRTPRPPSLTWSRRRSPVNATSAGWSASSPKSRRASPRGCSATSNTSSTGYRTTSAKRRCWPSRTPSNGPD
jgi:glycerol-3-phosphate dehydrogenase